jgi:hypothetical protein
MLIKGQAPKGLIAAQAGADYRHFRGELALAPQGQVTRPLQAEPHGPAGGKPAPISGGYEVVTAYPSPP